MKNPVEIILKRKVKCEAYALIMTVARYGDQSEILAILKLFEEHGSVNKSTVNEELLSQNANSQYGQNVLIVLESLGLIRAKFDSGKYELTEMGDESLKAGKIPYPSRGVSSVLVSSDPLLPAEILDVKDFDVSKTTQESGNNIKALPAEFIGVMKKLSKKTLELPVGNKERIVITDYSESGIRGRCNDDYGLSLRIRYGEKPELYFNSNEDVRIKCPDELESGRILEELLHDYGNMTEKNDEPVLLLRADGLTRSELKTFTKTFNLSGPQIEGYGSFLPLSIRNMSIFPETLSEAKKWAWKLVLGSIDRYIGKKEYDEITYKVCLKFADTYSAQNIASSIPNHDNLMKMAKSEDTELKDQFWYIVAPDDLSPRRDRE